MGFYKHLYDLIRPIDQTGVGTSLDSAPERRLANSGTGRVYGMEVLLNMRRQSDFRLAELYPLRSERRSDGLVIGHLILIKLTF